jgi:hypothetical protein
MATERYQHHLWTGSGSTDVSLHFQESGEVTCEIHSRWMGADERHYRLAGRYERSSETCGRIFIQQITVQSSDGSSPDTQSPASSEEGTGAVDLAALEVALIYEYVTVARSPVLYHPDEDLAVMATLGYAGWNRYFDLLLLADPFVVQAMDDLLKGKEEAPAEGVRAHFRQVVHGLDKLKFARITESSPMEMLDATDASCAR